MKNSKADQGQLPGPSRRPSPDPKLPRPRTAGELVDVCRGPCASPRPRPNQSRLLLGRLGLAPGRELAAPRVFRRARPPSAERVEGCVPSRILEIRLSFGATSSRTLQLQPLAQPALPSCPGRAPLDHKTRANSHSPRLAVAGFRPFVPRPNAQAAGFDEHHDRLGPKETSVGGPPVWPWVRPPRRALLGDWPAQHRPASSVRPFPTSARSGWPTTGHDLRRPPRPRFRLTPSAWATLADSDLLRPRVDTTIACFPAAPRDPGFRACSPASCR